MGGCLQLGLCLAVLCILGEAQGHLRIPLKRNIAHYFHGNLKTFHGRASQRLQIMYGKGSTGTVPLSDFQDVEYFGEVSLGTPGQYFNVLFDTGSADMWVPSSKCSFWQIGCWFHKKYNSKASTTYGRDGRPFYIKYVSGSAGGFLSQDSLKIEDVTVTNQTFAEVTGLNWAFYFMEFDGIFGLGFTKASVSQEPPPFLNMVQQKAVAKPFFSFYLSKDKNKAEGGELIFGATNNSHFTGRFTFVPIIKPAALWAFYLQGISVNGQAMGVNNVTAIVDSGTSLIAGPPKQIAAINNAIGAYGAGGLYMVDCKNMDNLPNVTFTINDVDFTFTPQDYILEMTRYFFLKICVSGFMEVDLGEPIYILGNVFMRRVYTQFNSQKEIIGFAHAA